MNVKKDYKSDSSKANGVVLSQSISAGSVVSKEATITIVINKVVTTPSNGGNTSTNTTGGNVGGNNSNNQSGNTTKNSTAGSNTSSENED